MNCGTVYLTVKRCTAEQYVGIPIYKNLGYSIKCSIAVQPNILKRCSAAQSNHRQTLYCGTVYPALKLYCYALIGKMASVLSGAFMCEK